MKTGGQESGAEATAGGQGHGFPFVWGPARPQFPPAWAGRFGEDRHGVFADFELNGVRFDWRWIPPGRFWMGSPHQKSWVPTEELPRHEVILTRGFWMGRTPVTQAQWGVVLEPNPAEFKGGNRPVETLTWNEARAFAEHLNRAVKGLSVTLPTEAQWEYACRAGTDGDFGDGSALTNVTGKDSALDRLGWFKGNSDGGAGNLETKAPNGWGLHDMHGLVWEWCLDGKRPYRDGLVVDPVGPCNEGPVHKRVIRGGSFTNFAVGCRAASRSAVPGGPNGGVVSSDIGFRLVAMGPDGVR